MTLHERCRIGFTAGMEPAQVVEALANLQPTRSTWDMAQWTLAVGRAGKGRRIAAETARLQKCFNSLEWGEGLAACWRLTRYSGKGKSVVWANVARIMSGLGAQKDADVFLGSLI